MLNRIRGTLVVTTLLASAAVASAQTTGVAAAPNPDTSVPGVMSGAPATAVGPSPGGMAETGMGKMMSAMPGMSSMMAPDQVEGRIAFQKAELAITDAQLPQWTKVADVLRHNAKVMQDGMAKMPKDGMPTAATDRDDMMVTMMSERLDGMKKLGLANKALYAVLTPDQRKIADDMAAHPMGMM